MEIKAGNFVKTYNLCDGEIAIGIIEKIVRRNKNISGWTCDKVIYEDGSIDNIVGDTAIWDKKHQRWLYSHNREEYVSAHSVIILDACQPDVVPYRLLVEGENIKLRY